MRRKPAGSAGGGRFAPDTSGKTTVPTPSEAPRSATFAAEPDSSGDYDATYTGYQEATRPSIDEREVARTLEWLSTMAHSDASSDICGCPACGPSSTDSPAVKEAVRQYRSGSRNMPLHDIDCHCFDCTP